MFNITPPVTATDAPVKPVPAPLGITGILFS